MLWLLPKQGTKNILDIFDFEFSTVNQQTFPSDNEGKTYLGLYFELKLL